jgi:DNA-binding NarL/FixJ family response regulator
MRPRVLVVAEDSLLRRVMRRAFQRARPTWDIVCAADLEGCAEHCAENPVDVVLADVDRAHSEGARALRWFEDNHPSVGRVALATPATLAVAGVADSPVAVCAVEPQRALATLDRVVESVRVPLARPGPS